MGGETLLAAARIADLLAAIVRRIVKPALKIGLTQLTGGHHIGTSSLRGATIFGASHQHGSSEDKKVYSFHKIGFKSNLSLFHQRASQGCVILVYVGSSMTNQQFDALPTAALESAGYRESARMGYNDLVTFLQPQLRSKNRVMLVFWALNLLLLLALIWKTTHLPAGSDWLGAIGLGFAGSFLLIPLHEWVHALAFRSLGATRIFYGANWKKLYFYAGADFFVLNHPGFTRVALAPCLLIGSLLLLIACFLPPFWQVSLLATLLLHTGMSAGDFALLAWFDAHRHQQPLTFDDHEAGVSYFFTL